MAGSRRRLLLDTSALRKVEKDPLSDLVACVRRAVWRRTPVLLPALVFAQVWRDDRQYGLRSLRRCCEPASFTETAAWRVGGLLAVSGTGDTVKAAVIVAAIEANAAVVTQDPGGLGALADAVGANVPLIAV